MLKDKRWSVSKGAKGVIKVGTNQLTPLIIKHTNPNVKLSVPQPFNIQDDDDSNVMMSDSEEVHLLSNDMPKEYLKSAITVECTKMNVFPTLFI